MKLVIGNDHAAVELKNEIKAYVESVDLSALDKIGHINLPA